MPGAKPPKGKGYWHNIALSNNQLDENDFFISPHLGGPGNSFYKENSELYKDDQQKIRLKTYELDNT